MNLRAARAALAEAARFGVTTIQDNSSVDALPTYQELRARGELTARMYVWRYADAMEPLMRPGVRTGLGDDWIRVGALKILSDGSMGSGTAAFFEPYADDPKTAGLLLHPVPELLRMIAEADAAGFQLAVHAIGDRANALVLDAFEKAARANGPRDRRFRIEHAQVVRKQDLPRFRALGVVASIQPSHCIDDMRWAEKRIGRARCRDAYNFRSFTDAGIAVAFGTDWSVEPLDPRLGLYAAVTREFPAGGPAGRLVPGGEDPARGRHRPLHAGLGLRGVRGEGQGHAGARQAGGPRGLRRGPVRGPAARDPDHARGPHGGGRESRVREGARARVAPT